ncbi:dual specificity mitogen-activated protein kinase kinase 4-like isoform X3 [Oratosquilla oratoria]|uniref:dual specificity mitogen-activated protein kinase kinase 4-like isoform X3 n=1 Tax=Oratosquilla oratoria TaxID=337810 RepID=UPI003F7636A6
MADQAQGSSRPSLPLTSTGRRSNLRLAIGQGNRSNDHAQSNLDFPASGYPSQMAPRPPFMSSALPPPSVRHQGVSASQPASASSQRNSSIPHTLNRRHAVHQQGLSLFAKSSDYPENTSGTHPSTVHQSNGQSSTVQEHSNSHPNAGQQPPNIHADTVQQRFNSHPSTVEQPSNASSSSASFVSPQTARSHSQMAEVSPQTSQLPPPSSAPPSNRKKHLHLNFHHHHPLTHNHHHHHQNHHHNHHHHYNHHQLLHHDGGHLRERGHKSGWEGIASARPPRYHIESSQDIILHCSILAYSRDRITRGIYQNMQTSGKLKISPEVQIEFTADDLTDMGEIGRGGFGTVNKMIHRKSNTIMAVKRIRSTVDEKEQKQLLMDLEVVMKSNDCLFIVQFYGALFKEGDCWICMELMDTSLDKFYKFIYERMHEQIPEKMLGKITVATLLALNYLKEHLKIIHRDVKPSNILLDKRGNIKLCDFGISGQLVDSIAKTRDAGCRPYMAPERIDPARARGYDVRSDVWSLGITLMELATGSFPYPKWNSVFEQLTQVVQGEPPRLSLNENGNTFSQEFVNFVNTCLIKDEGARPKYKQLLDHEFVRRADADSVDVATYVRSVLDRMANNGRQMFTHDSYNC